MTEAEIATATATAPTPAAPWAKEAETRFADEASRAAFDDYMRTVNQPYITKVEAERAEAQRVAQEAADKAWVHDAINEDPAAAFADIFAQVYGDDASARVAALISAGFTPEQAGGIVEEEETVALTKLPPEVQAAVEYATQAKAAQEQAAVDAATQVEVDAAKAEYDAWRGALLEKEPDIKESTLHRYVLSAEIADDATAQALFDAALAAYREDFPAPVVAGAPAVLGGRAAPDGGGPQDKPRTLAEAADRIWSAGASKK